MLLMFRWPIPSFLWTGIIPVQRCTSCTNVNLPQTRESPTPKRQKPELCLLLSRKKLKGSKEMEGRGKRRFGTSPNEGSLDIRMSNKSTAAFPPSPKLWSTPCVRIPCPRFGIIYGALSWNKDSTLLQKNILCPTPNFLKNIWCTDPVFK